MNDKILSDMRMQLIGVMDQVETLNTNVDKALLMIAALDLKSKIHTATIESRLELLSVHIEQLKRGA